MNAPTVTGPKFKQGDTVVLVSGRTYYQKRPLPATTTIASVGRKYFYLAGDVKRETPFDKFTGVEETRGYSNYADRVYVPDEWAVKSRREEVLATLSKDHGVSFRDGDRGALSLRKLERLLTVLQESDPEK